MSWELLLTKILGATFVVAVFAGAAFLLRFLYGPKGKFREPEWDAWNEAAGTTPWGKPAQEEAKREQTREAALREAFVGYA